MLLISALLILKCQKHSLLKIFKKKSFQDNLFVFAILIAFYIHYKPYEVILGRKSETGKSLEIICVDFKCHQKSSLWFFPNLKSANEALKTRITTPKRPLPLKAKMPTLKKACWP